MAHFKFLHAADLHLDSPLLGLNGKSPEFADRVEQASRRAFDKLVSLAIDESCRFVVLAGDVFDGDLRNFQTGLYFLAGVQRLRDAGIRVFMIAGNHDAENRFAGKLGYSDNVHLFAHKRSESIVLDDIDAVIHGRSFWQAQISENLALTYPAPHPNRFNVGVLHTACQGSEGHHAVYAPCSVEQLVNHGYDYWALGHVHTRLVLNERPHIVYPGNLQGRNPREIGSKGATLVEVADGTVVLCEHRDLDEVRWAAETVDITGAASRGDVLQQIRSALTEVCAVANERPVALRLTLGGESVLTGELLLSVAALREDIEAMLTTLPTDIWLERFDIAALMPEAADGIDPTIAGKLDAEVRRLGSAPETLALIESCLADIRIKIPAGARVDALFDRVRADAPARAIELARSLVAAAEGERAPE